MFGVPFKKLLKYGIITLAFVVFPWLVVGAGAAYLGIRTVRAVGKTYREGIDSVSGPKEKADIKSLERSKGLETGRRESLTEALHMPEGMEIVGAVRRIPNYRNTPGIAIRCDGLDGVVFATNPSGSKASKFIVPLMNHEDLGKAQLFCASLLNPGAVRIREHDGSCWLESSDAKAVKDFVNTLYEKSNSNVVDTTYEVNQYMISGCSSYEEAVEKLRSMGDTAEPIASHTGHEMTIDGVLVGDKFRCPTPMSLPVGTFIVNDVRTTHRQASVVVPCRNGKVSNEAIIEKFNSVETKKKVSVSEPFTEDASKAVKRTLELPVNLEQNEAQKGSVIDFVSAERFIAENCKDTVARLDFVTSKELDAFLKDGIIPKGTNVLLTKDAKPNDGTFSVTVPLDAGLFNTLGMSGRVAGAVAERQAENGVKKADVEASLCQWGLARNGGVSLVAGSDISLNKSNALVNGCPLDEVREAAARNVFENMSQERQARWMADAAKIDFANVYVDIKNKSVVVESQIRQNDGSSVFQRSEKKLTNDQLKNPAYLREFTASEAKDIVMKLFKDSGHFSTYAGRKVGNLFEPNSRTTVVNENRGQVPSQSQQSRQQKVPTIKVPPIRSLS